MTRRITIVSLARTLLAWALLTGILLNQAEADQRRPPARAATKAPAPRESQFYIKGPNAPFKNQIRKMTDPLNANGAGR